MRDKILIVGLIALLVMPIASADLIIPGTKYVDYCDKIININDYPDYVFLSYNYGPMSEGHTILKEDKCFPVGYKFSSTDVYMIKKSDFDEKRINFNALWVSLPENEKAEVKEKYDWLLEKFDGTEFVYDKKKDNYKSEINELTDYIYFNYNNDQLIKIIPFIQDFDILKKWNPLDHVTVYYKVLDRDGDFYVEKSVKKYYSMSMLSLYFLAIVALIVIVGVIIKKKRK